MGSRAQSSQQLRPGCESAECCVPCDCCQQSLQPSPSSTTHPFCTLRSSVVVPELAWVRETTWPLFPLQGNRAHAKPADTQPGCVDVPPEVLHRADCSQENTHSSFQGICLHSHIFLVQHLPSTQIFTQANTLLLLSAEVQVPLPAADKQLHHTRCCRLSAPKHWPCWHAGGQSSLPCL